MAREIYNRDRPHLNIGTIGHSSVGKTSLTIAICAHLGFPYEQCSDTINGIGMTTSPTHYQYQTNSRHYVHIDCPGHSNYRKGKVSGISLLDAAILVVDNESADPADYEEEILYASHFKLSLIVFINNCPNRTPDRGVRRMLQNTLNRYGFPDVPFVAGNIPVSINDALPIPGAFDIDLNNLIEVIDSIPNPTRELQWPFKMAISKIIPIKNVGTVIIGRIERGAVRIMDEIEIRGPRDTVLTTVTGVEMCRMVLNEGLAGDQVGLLLRGVEKKQIIGAQIAASPGSLNFGTSFRSTITATRFPLNREGFYMPLYTGYQTQHFFTGRAITGKILDTSNDDGSHFCTLNPGERFNLDFELFSPTHLEPGLQYLLKSNGEPIGFGIVDSAILKRSH